MRVWPWRTRSVHQAVVFVAGQGVQQALVDIDQQKKLHGRTGVGGGIRMMPQPALAACCNAAAVPCSAMEK